MTESFANIIPVDRIKSCLEVHKIYIQGKIIFKAVIYNSAE